MDNKIYGLIGICMKAGKVLSGSEQVESGIKKQKAFLLILATDSSEKTLKRYIEAASSISNLGNKNRIGAILRKKYKDSCSYY